MEEKRPIVKIERTVLDNTLDIFNGLVIIFMTAFVLIKYKSIPAQIPTHFGFNGQADDWGDKTMLIFLLIALIVLFVLITVLAHFPQSFNFPVDINESNAELMYKNAVRMLSFLKTELVLTFSYLEWAMIEGASKSTSALSILFLPIVLVAIFGTIGFFVMKMLKFNKEMKKTVDKK